MLKENSRSMEGKTGPKLSGGYTSDDSDNVAEDHFFDRGWLPIFHIYSCYFKADTQYSQEFLLKMNSWQQKKTAGNPATSSQPRSENDTTKNTSSSATHKWEHNDVRTTYLLSLHQASPNHLVGKQDECERGQSEEAIISEPTCHQSQQDLPNLDHRTQADHSQFPTDHSPSQEIFGDNLNEKPERKEVQPVTMKPGRRGREDTTRLTASSVGVEKGSRDRSRDKERCRVDKQLRKLAGKEEKLLAELHKLADIRQNLEVQLAEMKELDQTQSFVLSEEFLKKLRAWEATKDLVMSTGQQKQVIQINQKQIRKPQRHRSLDVGMMSSGADIPSRGAERADRSRPMQQCQTSAGRGTRNGSVCVQDLLKPAEMSLITQSNGSVKLSAARESEDYMQDKHLANLKHKTYLDIEDDSGNWTDVDPWLERCPGSKKVPQTSREQDYSIGLTGSSQNSRNVEYSTDEKQQSSTVATSEEAYKNGCMMLPLQNNWHNRACRTTSDSGTSQIHGDTECAWHGSNDITHHEPVAGSKSDGLTSNSSEAKKTAGGRKEIDFTACTISGDGKPADGSCNGQMIERSPIASNSLLHVPIIPSFRSRSPRQDALTPSSSRNASATPSSSPCRETSSITSFRDVTIMSSLSGNSCLAPSTASSSRRDTLTPSSSSSARRGSFTPSPLRRDSLIPSSSISPSPERKVPLLPLASSTYDVPPLSPGHSNSSVFPGQKTLIVSSFVESSPDDSKAAKEIAVWIPRHVDESTQTSCEMDEDMQQYILKRRDIRTEIFSEHPEAQIFSRSCINVLIDKQMGMNTTLAGSCEDTVTEKERQKVTDHNMTTVVASNCSLVAGCGIINVNTNLFANEERRVHRDANVQTNEAILPAEIDVLNRGTQTDATLRSDADTQTTDITFLKLVRDASPIIIGTGNLPGQSLSEVIQPHEVITSIATAGHALTFPIFANTSLCGNMHDDEIASHVFDVPECFPDKKATAVSSILGSPSGETCPVGAFDRPVQSNSTKTPTDTPSPPNKQRTSPCEYESAEVRTQSAFRPIRPSLSDRQPRLPYFEVKPIMSVEISRPRPIRSKLPYFEVRDILAKGCHQEWSKSQGHVTSYLQNRTENSRHILQPIAWASCSKNKLQTTAYAAKVLPTKQSIAAYVEDDLTNRDWHIEGLDRRRLACSSQGDNNKQSHRNKENFYEPSNRFSFSFQYINANGSISEKHSQIITSGIGTTEHPSSDLPTDDANMTQQNILTHDTHGDAKKTSLSNPDAQNDLVSSQSKSNALQILTSKRISAKQCRRNNRKKSSEIRWKNNITLGNFSKSTSEQVNFNVSEGDGCSNQYQGLRSSMASGSQHAMLFHSFENGTDQSIQKAPLYVDMNLMLKANGKDGANEPWNCKHRKRVITANNACGVAMDSSQPFTRQCEMVDHNNQPTCNDNRSASIESNPTPNGSKLVHACDLGRKNKYKSDIENITLSWRPQRKVYRSKLLQSVDHDKDKEDCVCCSDDDDEDDKDRSLSNISSVDAVNLTCTSGNKYTDMASNNPANSSCSFLPPPPPSSDPSSSSKATFSQTTMKETNRLFAHCTTAECNKEPICSTNENVSMHRCSANKETSVYSLPGRKYSKSSERDLLRDDVTGCRYEVTSERACKTNGLQRNECADGSGMNPSETWHGTSREGHGLTEPVTLSGIRTTPLAITKLKTAQELSLDHPTSSPNEGPENTHRTAFSHQFSITACTSHATTLPNNPIQQPTTSLTARADKSTDNFSGYRRKSTELLAVDERNKNKTTSSGTKIQISHCAENPITDIAEDVSPQHNEFICERADRYGDVTNPAKTRQTAALSQSHREKEDATTAGMSCQRQWTSSACRAGDSVCRALCIQGLSIEGSTDSDCDNNPVTTVAGSVIRIAGHDRTVAKYN